MQPRMVLAGSGFAFYEFFKIPSLPQKIRLTKYGYIAILSLTNFWGSLRVSKYVLKLPSGMVMPKNDYLGTIFNYCPEILIILLKLGSREVKKGKIYHF